MVYRARMVEVHGAYVDAVITASGHTRETYEGPFPFPEGTTIIGQMAFYKCHSLKEARIPETVTEIQYNAFTLCTSLEVVTLSPNLKVLNDGVFAHCRSLGAIVVPKGVERIETTALGYCTGLMGINFSGMPKYIDWDGFKGTHADFIVLPNPLAQKYFRYEDKYEGRPFARVHSMKKMLLSAKIILYGEESRWHWNGPPRWDEKIVVPAMTVMLMENILTPKFLGPSMSRQAIDRALAREPFLLPPTEINLKWLDFSRTLFQKSELNLRYLPDEIRLIILDFINGNVTAGLTELLKTFDVSRAIAPAGALYDHTV